ncbi:uncharacterized protein Z520_02223 [Fonsecaea multimorphosa CBS 102226]|uniref:Bacteriophage T5 Orf172 DNA-binding domain-containing protein n=1 Tax=Fonsecaea multimorphosa CBS 102226 TaxID=1442371 RepID=A0A0D2KF86_9EURO|nr:uncharacterized protein Z520_02223 [Fonsecaea multimorphosa CBS 102226]KIY02085.1 hypothetical protein Z520_02223 [Fonsecaea multimorphosa CBS 102226]OAL29284.1 hypothetical protein AYO22_02178 [Fonsecaea multimorphosa]
MLPAPFRQPVANHNLSDAGQPQTPDGSTVSNAARQQKRKQDQKTSKMISSMRKDLCQTATKKGYLYAVQIRGNGLVKVGTSGVDEEARPTTSIACCKFKPGKVFQTTNFYGAFKAEKLVHNLLSQWNETVECSTTVTKHEEYFSCGLGFAISAIDLVTTWFLKEPYLIEGQQGSLKDEWRDALDAFKESQRSEEPMEWFEFFLVDLETQVAWQRRPPALNCPGYLTSTPVQLLSTGTLHFGRKAKPGPVGSTKSSPAVAQTSSAARKVRQTDRSGLTMPSRAESAPPKASSDWDENSSHPETPSKPPKNSRRRSGMASKTEPSAGPRSQEGQEDRSQKDGKKVNGDKNKNKEDVQISVTEDKGNRMPVTGVDDTGLAAATSKLTLAEDEKTWGSSIANLFGRLRIQ